MSLTKGVLPFGFSALCHAESPVSLSHPISPVPGDAWRLHARRRALDIALTEFCPSHCFLFSWQCGTRTAPGAAVFVRIETFPSLFVWRTLPLDFTESRYKQKLTSMRQNSIENKLYVRNNWTVSLRQYSEQLARKQTCTQKSQALTEVKLTFSFNENLSSAWPPGEQSASFFTSAAESAGCALCVVVR